MTNETKTAANAQAAKKKVLRRGVTNETRSVNRIKFHEKDSVPNTGLFIGHLENVTVEWSSSDKNQDFPNINVPRLVFHFESNHSKIAERRYYGHTLWARASSIDTIPGGKHAMWVDGVFATIKHFLEVYYLNGRTLTSEEEEALSLDFFDYDENGNYIPVEQDEVIASYHKVFENAAAMFNGTYNLKDGDTPKPCYKSADGKLIPIWMKLLRHTKGKDGKWYNVQPNGDLGFTNSPDSGLIEKINGQNPPAILRINVARESITPKQTQPQNPTIGIRNPNNMVGTIVAPTGVPAMGASQTDAYIAAQNPTISGEDNMPF